MSGSSPPSNDQWARTALISIADAVITTDETGNVTFMNRTAESLTGFPADEGVGQPLDVVFSTQEGTESGDAAEGALPSVRLRTRAGEERIIEHTASPIVDATGQLFGVVVVFRDIGERRRVEQRLALADRMTSLGTLAAGIAHELNNPLAFVRSNLEFASGEIAELKAQLTGEAAERVGDVLDALREAGEGAERARQIIKDMRVFSKEPGEATVGLVDVNKAVSFAIRLAGHDIRHRAEITTHLEATWRVHGDDGKLVQVIVNLLTNAAHAIDATSAMKRITVTTANEIDHVLIRVIDTGHGIAQDDLPRVFEPFFTTKPVGQGLGLGLSISHTHIATFNGQISLESELGEGTTVTISLPSAEAAASVSAIPTAAASLAGRVLVVDDEALVCTAIRRILARQGVDVVVEEQGEKALERFVRGERYDAILCDMMMPGLTGADLYDQLSRVAPEQITRMIFMTGNALTPRTKEFFATTSNVRIDKPFGPADVRQAVDEVMRRHKEQLATRPTP